LTLLKTFLFLSSILGWEKFETFCGTSKVILGRFLVQLGRFAVRLRGQWRACKASKDDFPRAIP
jgi:hypothetical protein